MKHKSTSTTIAGLFSLVLLACLSPAAQAATCSTATAAGSWGITLTGTLILRNGLYLLPLFSGELQTWREISLEAKPETSVAAMPMRRSRDRGL